MDKIYIRDLAVNCIIGTEPKERVTLQTVLFNLVLECSLAKAGRTDRIEDTINYKGIRDRVAGFVAASKFELIESLAARVAELCLEDRRVTRVTVTVDKPGALTMARSVAVEVRRERRRARGRG